MDPGPFSFALIPGNRPGERTHPWASPGSPKNPAGKKDLKTGTASVSEHICSGRVMPLTANRDRRMRPSRKKPAERVGRIADPGVRAASSFLPRFPGGRDFARRVRQLSLSLDGHRLRGVRLLPQLLQPRLLAATAPGRRSHPLSGRVSPGSGSAIVHAGLLSHCQVVPARGAIIRLRLPDPYESELRPSPANLLASAFAIAATVPASCRGADVAEVKPSGPLSAPTHPRLSLFPIPRASARRRPGALAFRKDGAPARPRWSFSRPARRKPDRSAAAICALGNIEERVLVPETAGPVHARHHP